MKFAYPILALIVFVLGSCSSWKDIMVAKGDQSDAINNAIFDFLHSDKGDRTDDVFYVYARDINEEVLGVSIFGTSDKVLISTEDSIAFDYSGLPTGYIEQEGKLFYWHDSTKTATVTDSLVSTLMKYNLLDTMIVNAFIPESTIDHSKKGTDYYFCKNNLMKYKRVRTRRAMGYYDRECFTNCVKVSYEQ